MVGGHGIQYRAIGYDKIVTLPEDYYFSSARNYADLENEMEIVLLDLF